MTPGQRSAPDDHPQEGEEGEARQNEGREAREEAANADNAAWGGVLKDTVISNRETLVTYRPARKPGDGPNIATALVGPPT